MQKRKKTGFVQGFVTLGCLSLLTPTPPNVGSCFVPYFWRGDERTYNIVKITLCTTSNYQQIWHPDWPISLILSNIFEGVIEQNSVDLRK